jgi:excisionase family DNA binding protein
MMRNVVRNVPTEAKDLPLFATVDETAALLRTTRKAVYAMVERGLLPGVTRLGRRVLLRSDRLLEWLNQNCASSPKE